MKYFALLLFLFFQVSLKAQDDIVNISVDPNKTFQTIHGFGASDSWRVKFVGKYWPLDKRNKIADLLFSTEDDEDGSPIGIGLSTWRFYLGAGTFEQGDSSQIANEWRRAECFLKADGTYDWNRHEGQRWFLHAANKRGVPNFLAYPVSPPVYFTKNGLGFATKGDTGFNLEPARYIDYAKYLAKVIRHFDEAEDIHFDYLSPFNEPQWKWDEPNQEGTPATNAEIFEFTKVLSEEMSAQSLHTEIVVGEAGSINYLYAPGNHPKGNQIEVFFSDHSPFYLGNLPHVRKAISGHSYFSTWPIEKQVEARQKLARRMIEIDPELEYWQTEFCILEKSEEIGGGWGRDLGMPLALYVARVIHSDLGIANSCTWEWWTALSQVDYKDGLIHLDPIKSADAAPDVMFDGEVVETKLLWALGNFSRFVRPGMQRIDVQQDRNLSLIDEAGSIQSIGFKDEEQGKLVLVFINHQEKPGKINLNCAEPIKDEATMYVTDETRDLAKSMVKTEKLAIPARSVSTFILELD